MILTADFRNIREENILLPETGVPGNYSIYYHVRTGKKRFVWSGS